MTLLKKAAMAAFFDAPILAKIPKKCYNKLKF